MVDVDCSYIYKYFGGRYQFYLAISLFSFILPIVIFSYGSNLNQISGRKLVNQVISAFKPVAERVPLPAFFKLKQKREKVIVFWTQFFGQDWKDHIECNHGPTYTIDETRSCYFTPDREKVELADAVVFHGRDFNFNYLPKSRYPWQRWVFYLLESPIHAGFFGDQWNRLNKLQFNWTMTYHRSSDVMAPYGKIRNRPPPANGSEEEKLVDEKINNFTNNFWKRKRDAVWLVSNCHSQSSRDVIVSVFQKHGITVDAWGGCSGRKPEPEMKRMGPYNFYSRYRFYLSFENSMCDDYATEKDFMGLYYSYLAGTIPITYGYVNYSEYLPNGSYIDTKFFKRVEDLAFYIKKLSCPEANKTEIAAYYQWIKELNPLYESTWETDEDGIFVDTNYKRWFWKNMCEKLWEQDTRPADGQKTNYSSIVKDVQSRLGTCHPPNSLFLGLENLIGVNLQEVYRISV